MLELLDGLPDHVVGVRAIGDVDDDDYEDVLVPAIKASLEGRDKIRLLYVLGPEFHGYESDAMWEDLKLGVSTFTSYERIAVVSDAAWIRRSVKAFGWLMPGEVAVYGEADEAGARAWIVE